MTRTRAMSKSDRAALADALRHMRGAGIRQTDLAQVAGAKARLAYDKIAVRKAVRS